nr:uncharacterized protein LOC129270097 [Lytechinus pictus]
MLALLVFMATASFHVGGTASSCSTNYNLNYTIWLRFPCPRKEVGADLIQTIPKEYFPELPSILINSTSPDECSAFTEKAILRLCRIPDCISNPCQNGRCEET